MKQTFLFLSVILLLIGCKPKYAEVVQLLHPDGSRQIVYYYEVHNSDSSLKMMREFYPSSSIVRIEGSFKDNKRDGVWKSWRQNGLVWSEAEYKNGINHGFSKVYHENGKLYYSGKYKDDQRIGVWRFYDDLGNLIKEMNYD